MRTAPWSCIVSPHGRLSGNDHDQSTTCRRIFSAFHGRSIASLCQQPRGFCVDARFRAVTAMQQVAGRPLSVRERALDRGVEAHPDLWSFACGAALSRTRDGAVAAGVAALEARENAGKGVLATVITEQSSAKSRACEERNPIEVPEVRGRATCGHLRPWRPQAPQLLAQPSPLWPCPAAGLLGLSHPSGASSRPRRRLTPTTTTLQSHHPPPCFSPPDRPFRHLSHFAPNSTSLHETAVKAISKREVSCVDPVQRGV